MTHLDTLSSGSTSMKHICGGPMPIRQPILHTPWTQYRPIGQTLPHCAQLFLSFWRLASQPVLGAPSQFSKPGLHLPSTQWPLVQVALALGRPLHGVPQPPQLLTSVSTGVSQPSLTSPLQSSKPNTHDWT